MQGTENEAKEEEDHYTKRIKNMKEIIQDIQMRLTVRDDPEDEGLLIEPERPTF